MGHGFLEFNGSKVSFWFDVVVLAVTALSFYKVNNAYVAAEQVKADFVPPGVQAFPVWEKALVEQTILENKPFIIRRWNEDGPLMKLWKAEWFERVVGRAKINVYKAKSEGAGAEAKYYPTSKRKAMSMGDYIKSEGKKVVSKDGVVRTIRYYAADLAVSSKDLIPLGRTLFPPPVTRRDLLKLPPTMDFGYGGERSAAQYSTQDQFVHVVKGEKKFLLVNPFEANRLIDAVENEGEKQLFSKVDLDADFSKDNKLKLLNVLEVSARAGDVVYIPKYWWTQVKNPADQVSISVSYTYVKHEKPELAAALRG